MELSVNKVPNLILAEDQVLERAVIYDLDRYEEGKTLDDLEVWSLPIGHAAGIKFRQNTVFGDVIIVGGSHSAIYEYPSGRKIWGTDNSGNNTHSVELLPSGNIVFTNTHGSCLRLFFTSALLEGNEEKAQEYLDYPKSWAYSAVWDPERNVLWSGGNRLEAYAVKGEGVNQTLCLLDDRGYTYPAHDMMPDYTDSRYLYMAGNQVLRYDKETNTVSEAFPTCDVLQGVALKAFCNNPNGYFFCNGPLGGKGTFFEGFWKESWLSNKIIVLVPETAADGTVRFVRHDLTSSKSAFYRVRPFYGKYL